MKGDWHLVITDISLMDLKAQGVYLAVSLSGDESNKKQSTPVHKKGTTFEFTVEGAALLDTRLEFKIEKKDSSGCRTDVVGGVDVPVKDLLVSGFAGDMRRKVLSREGTSSSPKTMAVLEFSYKFGERFPVEVPLELKEETVTANPAAAAPPQSHTPPMPPPPMANQQTVVPNCPPAVNTGMGYTAHQPTAVPPPALNTGETVWGPPPPPYPQTPYQHITAYRPPPYPQTTYHHNAAAPAYFYGPSAGYQYNAPTYSPPIPAPYHQMAYVPNVRPTHFYGPPPPPPHPGRSFLGRVGAGAAMSLVTNVFADILFNGGDFTGAWL